jgi:flavin reductase (DIM6/NTAB) family NADH-FMN oxidoreductase RutF
MPTASARPGKSVRRPAMTPGPRVVRQPPSRTFDDRAFRSAVGRFATGVIVVTVGPRRDPRAMTANAFMSGSLEPPLIVVSVGRTARMHERLNGVRRFGVSILDREQEPASRHFAGQAIPHYSPEFGVLAGVPVLARAAVVIAVRVEHRYACGDHTLFVGKVEELAVNEGSVPLVYHNGRYRALEALSATPDTSPHPYPSFF